MTFPTRETRFTRSKALSGQSRWLAGLTSTALLATTMTGLAALQVTAAPPAAAATSNNYCGGVGTWNGSQCVYTSQSSGSWTKPSWVSSYRIDLVGGGGGGKGMNSSNTLRDDLQGYAGSAGSLSSNASASASMVTFTIGAGGDAGAGNNIGGNGGTSTATGVSDAAGGAGGVNFGNCSSGWPNSNQQAKPGPLSGYTSYGSSGAGGTQKSDMAPGPGSGNCFSSFPAGVVAAGAGQAGGIVIAFSSAPTPSNPSGVSATANATNASFQVAFTESGNLGGLVPTYTATCTATGGVTVSGTASSSPMTVTGPATRGKNYVCSVQTSTLGGTSNSVSSSSVLMPGAPQNTVIPSFTGTLAFTTPTAQTLTGDEGTWSDFGFPISSYTYLWQSQTNCTGAWGDAAGSTKAQLNYTIVSGDVGKCLRLKVTATNVYGESDPAYSTSFATVEVTTAPTFTAASPPVIGDVGYAFNGVAGGYAFQASGGRITYSLSPSVYNAAASPTGLPATLTINSSTGALSGTPTTGQEGVYTYRVVATNASGSATTATLTLTISDGTPAQISIATQPAGGMASGTALTTQPVVELKDSSGRLIAQPQAIVATSSGGTLGGTTSVTTVNGVSTYTNLTLAGLTNTNYTLTFTRSSVTAVSNAIQVMSGALASISVTTQPVAAAAAGDLLATQPVVTLRDAQTNVIDDRSSTVVVTSELASGGAGGALGGTTTLTTTTGVATFTNLTFGGTVSTNYKLKFTSGAITALSGNISNTQAGAPTQLFIQTQPTIGGTDVVGSAFATQPVVRILDAGGNLTTSTATVTATASGGTLSGTTSIPAVAGTATYTDLSFAGLVSTPYTLTFASTGLTSATSSSFQYGAGRFGPVSLTISTITASPPSRPADGSSTSGITVQTKDAGGNNLTTSQGTVTLATTAGSLGSVADLTNGSYSATLTTPVGRGSGSAVVSGTLNGSALLSTATVSLFDAQTITFAQPANVPLGTLPYQLVASASSGLPVVFSLGSGTTNSACSVTAAGVVTINAVGSCEIQADQAGSAIYWPAPQVVRTYAVAATTPTAPFITSVTEGNGQATVAFTPPGFDGGATITNYEYSLDGGVNWTPLSPTDALSPVTIPSLTNLTGYQVSLRAVNSAGAGLASSASPAFTPRASGGTTVTAATTTPSAPRNPETLSQSEGAVTVSWQEPQSNGGATITSYTVEVAPSGTCTATIAATSRVGSCTIGGLVPGRAYTFTIRAVNSNGAGTAAVISYLVPGGPGPAPTITLTLDPNGGTCTVGSISGPATSWGALPSASQCSRTSAILTGWKPVYSTTLYAPGTQVQFIDNNTLRAVWLTSQGPASTPGASVTPRGQVRWVVWTADGKHVRAGRPKEMLAHHPVVTIVTRDSAKVTRQQIDTARSMAREYEGVYAGVVRANWWNRPRIVAAYVASTETAQ